MQKSLCDALIFCAISHYQPCLIWLVPHLDQTLLVIMNDELMEYASMKSLL